jgi:hypothetical protein
MTFQNAFQNSEVQEALEQGLRALGQYSSLIQTDDTTGFEGSVDLDRALARKYPNDNRWDYAFGHRSHIFYVEVHHVSDSQVMVMIAKYRWLRNWISGQGQPEELRLNSSYHWLSTGKGSLAKNSRYTRSLASAGLDFPKKYLKV